MKYMPLHLKLISSIKPQLALYIKYWLDKNTWPNKIDLWRCLFHSLETLYTMYYISNTTFYTQTYTHTYRDHIGHELPWIGPTKLPIRTTSPGKFVYGKLTVTHA